jgi:hypothetical protein
MENTNDSPKVTDSAPSPEKGAKMKEGKAEKLYKIFQGWIKELTEYPPLPSGHHVIPLEWELMTSTSFESLPTHLRQKFEKLAQDL